MRGLDYYRGTTFEFVGGTLDSAQNALGGGGRYDGMIGRFLGTDVPATGMSLGLERIIEVVHEFNLLPSPKTVAQVMVAVFPDLIEQSALLAAEMRAFGYRVDLSLLSRKSVGEQLKNADRRGIPLRPGWPQDR